MYDAYEVIPILEKLPLQIESITAYGKYRNINLLNIKKIVFVGN